jgi:hypothetical protein
VQPRTTINRRLRKTDSCLLFSITRRRQARNISKNIVLRFLRLCVRKSLSHHHQYNQIIRERTASPSQSPRKSLSLSVAQACRLPTPWPSHRWRDFVQRSVPPRTGPAFSEHQSVPALVVELKMRKKSAESASCRGDLSLDSEGTMPPVLLAILQPWHAMLVDRG